MTDLGAGFYCANAILAAYIERLRTGEGQVIDTSLYEAALVFSIWETTALWATAQTPRAQGSALRFFAPYQALRTSDGHVVVAANNHRLWTRLCEAIGRPDLLEDQRFASNTDLLRNASDLAGELERTLVTRTTAEWVDLLLAAGTPAGPIHDYRQVVADARTLARDMIQQVKHGTEGLMNVLGPAVKLSRAPARIRATAPRLGEHTEEVLAEIGYDAARLTSVHSPPRTERPETS